MSYIMNIVMTFYKTKRYNTDQQRTLNNSYNTPNSGKITILSPKLHDKYIVNIFEMILKFSQNISHLNFAKSLRMLQNIKSLRILQ